MSLYPTMVFGTPNYCYMQSGYACYTPRLAAGRLHHGRDLSRDGTTPARCPAAGTTSATSFTEVMVMWGKAPLESNPDGFFGHAVVDAMRRGTRSSRSTRVSTGCPPAPTSIIRLRAGTDTALAMAMLNIIINEGPLRPRVRRSTGATGSSQLAERVQDDAARTGRRDLRRAGARRSTPPPACTRRPSRPPSCGALPWTRRPTACRTASASSRCRPSRATSTAPAASFVPGADAGHNELGFGYKECIPDELFQKMIGMDRVSGVLQHDPELPGGPHARGAGDRRALSHPHGLLHGATNPLSELLHGAQALA